MSSPPPNEAPVALSSQRALLSELVGGTRGEPSTRRGRAAVEAFVATAIGVALAIYLGLTEAGVVSIFLASTALAPSADLILRENRDAIWKHGETSWVANRRTALSLFAIFMGMMSAYVTTAVFLGEGRARASFRFALMAANLGSDTILSRSFGSFWGLLGHNLAVLLTLAVLTILYRTSGALLSLAWNACCWGLVLTFLVQRGAATPGAAWPAFISGIAVLPHLCLEALGYVVGSMAAVFLSKGMSKYKLSDPAMRAVLGACGRMALIAIALIALGAATEHLLTAAVAKALRT